MTSPAHELIADGDESVCDVYVLHGILGSAQNWRNYTRKHLAPANPRLRFVLVDLRHHGDSDDLPGPDTLVGCSEDLDRLAHELGRRPVAVIGHSFGGKVALVYARERLAESSSSPDGHTDADDAALQQVWALDILPGAVDDEDLARHSDVIHVIGALRELPMPVDRRRDLVPMLTERGFTDQLARWMTTNLDPVPEGDGYSWTFDLDGIDRLLEDYRREDLWPFLEAVPVGLDVHFVRAGRSSRWTDAVVERLTGLERVQVHTLEDAGHWVHVDDPEGLADVLNVHLDDLDTIEPRGVSESHTSR